MLVSYTHKRLYRVGLLPLEYAVEDVKQLAQAVWYHGYRPTKEELEHLSGVISREQFQRTLCVLELLSQYPVCPREIALDLQQLTKCFHQQLLGNDETPVQGRYSPSKRWGLNDSTSSVRKALLPLQNRTYADSTGCRHGLSV